MGIDWRAWGSARATRRSVMALAGIALCIGTAHAQERRMFQASGALVGALVVGGSSDYLNGGLGPELAGLFSLDRRGVLSIRADVTYLPLVAADDAVSDVSADNTLLLATFGLQTELPLGPVRPYAYAAAGLAKNSYERHDPARNVDLTGSSNAEMWSLGTGLRIDVTPQPISLDLGGRLTHTGNLDSAGNDSSIRGDIATLQARVGVIIGIR